MIDQVFKCKDIKKTSRVFLEKLIEEKEGRREGENVEKE